MSKQISVEEVRKGDRIRVITDAGSSIEGVAYYQSGCCWQDEGGDRLLCTNRSGITVLLIDRPKPPLPTVPGTVFRATEIRGEECDVTVLVCELYGGDRDVFYVSHKRVQGFAIHRGPDHITAWEPIEGNKNNG